MKIALDIDDTITKYPEFFSKLSLQHEAVIVTSRPDTDESKRETKQLLDELSIHYVDIYFCDWSGEAGINFPVKLAGPELLLYQKVIACKRADVDAIFDDDSTVQLLMKEYLPNLAIFSPI